MVDKNRGRSIGTASVADLIATAFPRLPPKQQTVARFVAAHEAETAFTPATEVADRLGVDPATVVRLAKALGFGGYPDLQRHLRARFPHHYPALSQPVWRDGVESDGPGAARRVFAQDFENLRIGLEQLNQHALAATVESIGQARRVLVFGGGVASGVVVFLTSSLKAMGFVAEQDTCGGLPLTQELALLAPQDVVIAVGFYRYVRETVLALERIQDLPIVRVVLTDSPLSPLVPLGHYALCVPVESTSHRVSLVAPLAVANCLIAGCAARYHDRVTPALQRLDELYSKAAHLIYK
jgi:DNA-binding MurR/RpiR family transcriptional regulator